MIETFYLDLIETVIPQDEKTIHDQTYESSVDIEREEREEHFYHLPSMSFTEYLCSIGGIVSMWIGFSIWDKVIQLFHIFFYTVKCNNIFKSIKLIVLSVCLILSSIQTLSSFKEYFSYEYIIRTSSQVLFNFPTFEYLISATPDDNFTSEFNKNNVEERKKVVDKMFYGINEIKCSIRSKNKSVNCDQFYDKVEYYKWESHESYTTLYRLVNFERKSMNDDYMNWKSFEDKPRIEIIANTTSSLNIAIQLDRGSFGDIYFVWMSVNQRNTVKFIQRSFQFLEPPYSTDCYNYDPMNQNDNLKSEQRCYHNCITNSERKLECFLIGNFIADEFFSRKLIYCSNQSLLESKVNFGEKIEQCKHDCKPDCHLDYYDFDIESIDDLKLLDTSILNIFASEKPYLSYIYTPKIDVDQLVYNLGGIISLWFGLSANVLMHAILEFVKFVSTREKSPI
jgi:hypothetical protein